MLLDRSERDGFKPDEALILLEHRNLKGQYNRYLETFMEFIKYIEQIEMNDIVSMTALRRLVKIYKDADKVSRFIQKVIWLDNIKEAELFPRDMQRVTP